MASFYFYDSEDNFQGAMVNVSQEEANRLADSWGWRVASVSELEEQAQQITEELTNDNEKFKALALATVDLRMADITGLTQAEVRQRFKDRVLFYLRQDRGL